MYDPPSLLFKETNSFYNNMYTRSSIIYSRLIKIGLYIDKK
ncbi:glycosyl transferase family protein [Listeria monocytogenes FSL F2-208]|nr:glycosyl transferase family protein [Listeria monocytogenes FSL F2-208]